MNSSGELSHLRGTPWEPSGLEASLPEVWVS